MKLNKKQKIITSLIGTGAILGLSLGLTIPLLTNKTSGNDSKINKTIKEKIQNKNLVIPKSVNTFSDSEILLAIKNQLKLKNPSLTNQDLLKITDNVQHLKPGKKTSVILTIEANNEINIFNVNVTKEKDIKLWTKNSAIVTNSNINDGRYSSFIQDSSGNLWAMGGESGRKDQYGYKPTKLQVLKRDGTQWEEGINSGLTNGSNIVNGNKGVIFEDDFGNLWAMGTDSKLQVLVKNKDGSYASSWVNDNSKNGEKLLQGSLITNGKTGKIFQDSFGNLWATGKDSKLQILVKNKDGSYASSWDSDNSENGKLLRNSNITNSEDATIFQDFFGNLWAMAKGSKLQVLKVNQNGDGYVTSWTNDNLNTSDLLLRNSNIIRGTDGTIFQDSFGNLWSMGGGTAPQVLKINENGDNYVTTGWTNDRTKGLLFNSNILRCGFNEEFFQDSFGNLWVQGYHKKTQVLKVNPNSDGYVTTGWTNDKSQGLLNNLKTHKRGESGDSSWVFFQDSFKNLWATGNQVPLQVLKANSNGDVYVSSWESATNVPGLLKGSNIIDGQKGTIFEDSSKNLWSMGHNKKLQVYDKTQKKWIS